jgi:competence protein ComEA
MKRILLAIVMLLVSSVALAAVNINMATQAELEALNGIGPVKAKAIIDYRNANGPFRTPEDIMKVKGIKEGEFGKIRSDITVTGATSVPAAPQKSAEKAAPAKTPEPPKSAPATTTAEVAATDKAAADKEAKAKAKEEKAAKAKADKEAKAKAKEDKSAKAKTDKDAAKTDKSKASDTSAKKDEDAAKAKK